MKLVIKARVPKDPRYQVRFWSTEKLYKQFTALCDQKQIKYQDAFTQFMEWFVKEERLGDAWPRAVTSNDLDGANIKDEPTW